MSRVAVSDLTEVSSLENRNLQGLCICTYRGFALFADASGLCVLEHCDGFMTQETRYSIALNENCIVNGSTEVSFLSFDGGIQASLLRSQVAVPAETSHFVPLGAIVNIPREKQLSLTANFIKINNRKVVVFDEKGMMNLSIWNIDHDIPQSGKLFAANATTRLPRAGPTGSKSLANFELHVDTRQGGWIAFYPQVFTRPSCGDRYDAEVAETIKEPMRRAISVDLIVNIFDVSVVDAVKKTWTKKDGSQGERQTVTCRFGRTPQTFEFTIWDEFLFVKKDAVISIYGAKTSIFRESTAFATCSLTFISVHSGARASSLTTEEAPSSRRRPRTVLPDEDVDDDCVSVNLRLGSTCTPGRTPSRSTNDTPSAPSSRMPASPSLIDEPFET